MKNVLSKTKLLLLTGLLLFNISTLLASPNEVYQDKNVSGVITDDKGEPLPGVSVVIKGTTKGTMTDLDGIYTIDISDPNAVLEITYMGFKAQSIQKLGVFR